MNNKITDAIAILDMEFEGDAEYEKAVAREHLNAIVARDIFRLRTEHGLSQRQLADLVGTKQSAISRLEDANYDGHSLSMLERIAVALKCRVEVRLIPDYESKAHAMDVLSEDSMLVS